MRRIPQSLPVWKGLALAALFLGACRSVKREHYELTPEPRLLPAMVAVGQGDYFHDFLAGGVFQAAANVPAKGFLVSDESVATTFTERKGRLFLTSVLMGLPSLLGMPVGEATSTASVSLRIFDARGEELIEMRSTGQGEATVACWYGYTTTGSREVASAEALEAASNKLLDRLRERLPEVEQRLQAAGPLTPASYNTLAELRPEVARRIELSADERGALLDWMDATAMQGRARSAEPAHRVWNLAGETWQAEMERAAAERGEQSKALVTGENERRIGVIEAMQPGVGTPRAFQSEWNASDPSVGLLGVVGWLHDPARSTYILGIHRDSATATAGRTGDPVQDLYELQKKSASAGVLSVRRSGKVSAQSLPLPSDSDRYMESAHLTLGERALEMARGSETELLFEVRYVDGRLRQVIRLDGR